MLDLRTLWMGSCWTFAVKDREIFQPNLQSFKLNSEGSNESNTVKGQSRSDSLLLSPYHWAKLFRGVVAIVAVPMRFAMICWVVLEAFVGQIHVFRWVLGWPYYIWFAEVVLWLSHRLSLLLFSCFPLFTPSYSFSNQAILAEWLFVIQSSAGRRAVCSGRGGLSRDCYAATLYPSNEGNPLVFRWIAVTLLWPGRGDFSASGLSTFKKIALTSALDCTWF